MFSTHLRSLCREGDYTRAPFSFWFQVSATGLLFLRKMFLQYFVPQGVSAPRHPSVNFNVVSELLYFLRPRSGCRNQIMDKREYPKVCKMLVHSTLVSFSGQFSFIFAVFRGKPCFRSKLHKTLKRTLGLDARDGRFFALSNKSRDMECLICFGKCCLSVVCHCKEEQCHQFSQYGHEIDINSIAMLTTACQLRHYHVTWTSF